MSLNTGLFILYRFKLGDTAVKLSLRRYSKLFS